MVAQKVTLDCTLLIRISIPQPLNEGVLRDCTLVIRILNRYNIISPMARSIPIPYLLGDGMLGARAEEVGTESCG